MSRSESGTVSAQALLSQWMRLVLEGLSRAGVVHVVLSPGSRNTPLLAALTGDDRFVCHSVIDERTAAFFALGLGKGLDEPVALGCTSGSAGAHYLPALIEAHHSRVAILAITADRPAELQGCGAEQSIDQTHLFGAYARRVPPLPEPQAQPDKLNAVLQQSYRAATATLLPHPGPVHLNFPLAKPLEPRAPETGAERAWEARTAHLVQRGPGTMQPASDGVDAAARWLEEFAQGDGPLALSLGPCTAREARAARDLARESGLPLLAEMAHVGEAAPASEVFERWQEAPQCAPRRLLHLGAPCVSLGWTDWMRATDTELWTAAGPLLRDPSGRVRSHYLGPLPSLARAVSEKRVSFPRDEEFQRGTAALCDAAREARRSRVFSHGEFDSPRVVYEILEAAAPDWPIFLGNSLPVRIAAEVSPLLSSGRNFFFSRGANGIDGAIATASGMARVHEPVPSVALIGDVTAAHDLGSLAVARTARAPFLLVVLDNAGGRIFDRLPAARQFGARAEQWDFWRTPPRIEWEAAARTFGIHFARATSTAELNEAVSTASGRPGCTLLVAALPPRT